MTDLRLTVTLAARGLDVAFDVGAGEVMAVLGPNGAGKSTILRVIAGLVTPDTGFVGTGERTLTDTATGVRIPAHDRRVGLLLQDPLLFPHMTVLSNVAFGLRSRRVARSEARGRSQRWLAELGVAELADRKPPELSGGQAQRVALARALAAGAEVLLLDEPLSGLDVAGAASVRALLSQVVRTGGRSAVLVTHDLLDVLALADRVLVIEDGRVAEAGPVADVLAAPRSGFGARIAGVNLVRGTIAAPGALRAQSGTWHGVGTDALRVGDSAVAVFSPGAVAVYRDLPHGSPRNRVRVRVAGLDVRGAAVRVRAEDQPDGAPGLAADVTAPSAADLRLALGQQVWFTVKAQEVALHPASRSAVGSL